MEMWLLKVSTREQNNRKQIFKYIILRYLEDMRTHPICLYLIHHRFLYQFWLSYHAFQPRFSQNAFVCQHQSVLLWVSLTARWCMINIIELIVNPRNMLITIVRTTHLARLLLIAIRIDRRTCEGDTVVKY